jgi:hypothetical protein
MKPLILALALTLGLPALVPAQAVQHGAQPNPQEVRPGSPEGDSPSTAVGTLERDTVERRILGLPVNALLVIGGVLVVLLVVGGIVIPRARRRSQARGGGTY